MKSDFKPPSIFDDGETIMPRKKPVTFAESNVADHTEAQMPENRKYIVLDAALWDTDIDSVFEFGNKHCCLFATKAAEHELDYVAPYLFAYVAGDELSKRVKYRETTGMRALYISSHLSPEQLRKHLRQFLRVKTEDGKWMLFRFYDPYVMMDAFSFLTESQQYEFLSNIESIQWKCPLSKEIETIKNICFEDKKHESDPHSHINNMWILTRKQLKEIGRAVFVRRAAMKIQKDKRSGMDAKHLLSFVNDKLAQAEGYGINREGTVYDYLLLCLKYNLLQYVALPNDLHLVLSNAERNQFQKINDLKKVLKKYYTI